MTDKEKEVMTALCDAVVRLVRNVYPGYPEEQMAVAPNLTITQCRKMVRTNDV